MSIFTTVGTEEKKLFIQKRFPQIPQDHIGNSRDTSFEEQILEATGGHGVDMVLNSLSGEKLLAGIRCLANHGKFLDIGVYDAINNMPVGMRPFLKNIEFIGAGADSILTGTEASKRKLHKMMEEGIASGVVEPLPRHVFKQNQLAEAFRFMASGKHIGKVVFKLRNEIEQQHAFPVPASPRTYFSRDKTYIIIGGLGGMGLELANWMIERGARHLILASRSGVNNGYQLVPVHTEMDNRFQGKR